MLDFILWIILIVIILRVLARFIFPIILKYFLKRVQQNIFQQPFEHETNYKEGETVINHVPEKKNVESDNIGEYVEYEEIKK